MSDELGATPVEEAASVVEEAVVPEIPADEPDSFEVPEEGRYVPVSALAKERAKRQGAEEKAARADQLEQELTQTKAKLQESAPVVQAAQAIIAASQQQVVQAPAPVEDTSELQEIARDFDLWKPDGTPDLERAKRIQTREQANARRIADEATAPMVVRGLMKDADYNLARAKNTKYPDGSTADPAILDQLWGDMRKDVHGLRALANEQTAQLVFNQAYAMTMAQKTARTGPTLPTPPVPPPALHTETAGGHVAGLPSLTAADRRTAKDMDMTESEYQKTLATMPAGWGKR